MNWFKRQNSSLRNRSLARVQHTHLHCWQEGEHRVTGTTYMGESNGTNWRLYLQGGPDKSLARPRTKQATATKLGIYLTYSPRSSIHFLARYSNFCNRLKKNQNTVRPTRSPRQQWPPRLKKNSDLTIVFPVQGTGGSPTGPDPENSVGDQDTGSPGRPGSSGLQVPGDSGCCRARTRPPWWTSRTAAFFLQNVLQMQQHR